MAGVNADLHRGAPQIDDYQKLASENKCLKFNLKLQETQGQRTTGMQ
jgi:hypothetical protein